MKELELYYCPYCGKIVAVVKKTNVPTVCCGMPMQKIEPGTVDASIEKHVPVIRQDGRKVTIMVGSEEHPSTVEHFIEWIVLLTSKGLHAKSIGPGEKPLAIFQLNENEDVQAAMEYCNLHKLWKKDVA
ncbi:MAG: desulfoferrodoxin [Treponema sp.]|nr:desulfoferrodoxin [Candidatus Treponema caballi]